MNDTLWQGLLLEYATLAWNIVGCVIVIILALKAASLSLFGFGIDSVIEIFASVIVIWQLKAINRDRERLATRLIAAAFVGLSLYLVIQAVVELVQGTHRPHSSPLGIAWLAVTAVVMFGLAHGKKKAGTALQNPVLLAEAKVTVVDGLLALSVLIGLLLNACLGWWWADILASLVIVAYGVREAVHLC